MNGSPPDGIGAALARSFMERLAADPEWEAEIALSMRPPGSTCGFPPSRAAPSQSFGRIGSLPMRNTSGGKPRGASVIPEMLSGTRTNDQ